jgi:hypothetical protein
MAADIEKMKSNNPFILELTDLLNQNYQFDKEFSVVFGLGSTDDFTVFYPVILNEEIVKLVIYSNINSESRFRILDKDLFVNFLNSHTNKSDGEISNAIILASALQIVQFRLNGSLDSSYYRFLQENLEFRPKSDGTRNCWNEGTHIVWDIINITVVENGALVEHLIAHIVHFASYWACEGETWADFGGGWIDPNTNPGGGSGYSNLQTPPNNIIDPDCWQNGITASVKSEIKKMLENLTDPCQKNAIEQVITNALIDLCSQRSENTNTVDADAFVETLEDALFSQEVISDIYNNLGFGSSLDQSQGNPLAPTNRLCPNNIVITPSSWHPNDQNVAGISGLQVSLNNGAVNLTFENLFFDVDKPKNCDYPTEQLIADAINSAIIIANQRLINGTPIFPVAIFTNENLQFTRLIEEQIGVLGRNRGCEGPIINGRPTFFAGRATPSNYQNSLNVDCHRGAQFIRFNNLTTGPGC